MAMPLNTQKARELFLHAVGKLPPEQWEGYVAEACGGDAELAQQVRHLLNVHREAGSFLDRPAEAIGETGAFTPEPGAVTPAVTLQERAGMVIGPYKLLQQIGEGGMGIVFMAEQIQPVQRKVALKLIKSGMDSRQVIARFEAERQALALMDHPNIAKVLDAGATKTGQPYFVMELVKGVPITRYCDEHHLTPKQRLELFVPVCQAVQHAHQKGIIHRDLKPSNVMVCLYDGKPVPKVIDFGVAKAAGPKLTEKTLFTELGQVVGTLEYMSPEQAELNQLDIDTRSDIYSLGVLLYELLTGTTPLERSRFQDVAFLEVLRLIREEETPRPSTRLSTTEELPTIAANRGLEPKKLSGLMRGELDWIVMKTLEKDRNRRYETANALAADVQRYLHDEPVQACPPSVTYRLRKFTRRHKAALGTTAAVLLAVLLTTGGFGWTLWDRVRRHADTAHEVSLALARTEQLAEQARAMPGAKSEDAAAALVVWRQAEDALGQAAAVLSAGTADDDMRQRVAAARTEVATGRLKAERGLASAQRKEKIFRDLDEARMTRLTVIDQQFDRAKAAAKFAAAFAAYGLDLAEDRTDEVARQISAAEPEVREALLMALVEWSNDAAASKTTWSPEKLRALFKAADSNIWRHQYRAAASANDTKALRDLGAEALKLPLPASTLILVATDFNSRGLRDEALLLLRHGRSRYPADFWLHFTLGSWLRAGKARTPREHEEAIGCFRAALALRPGSSAIHNNLGAALYEAGQLDEAMAELKTTIELDPTIAMAHTNVAFVFHARKQLDEAFAEYTKATELDSKDARPHNGLGLIWYAKKHLDKATASYQRAIELNAEYAAPHFGLGNILFDKKKFDEAMGEYRKVIELDDADPVPHNNLGNALRAMKRLAEATAEYQKAIHLDAKLSSPHNGLGNVFYDQKQLDKAMAEYQKAIDLDPTAPRPHNGLGNVLYDKKKFAEAMAEFQKAIDLDLKYAPPHSGLGLLLYDKKQLDKAMAEFRKAIDLDPTDPRPHNGLGLVLRGKNKLDEAIAEYRKAIDLDPKNAAAYNGLGNVLRNKNKLDEAMAAYRKAIELDPTDAMPHDGLGDVLRDMKKLSEAKKEYEKAINLDPKFALPHIGVGIVLYHQKQFDAAIVEYRKAIDLDPTDADPHINLGLAWHQKGQLKEAVAEFRKAVELDPKHLVAQTSLGNTLAELNQWDEAVVEFQKASDLQPDNPGPLFNLGRSLRRTGRFAEALQAMRKSENLGSRQPGWSMPTAEWIKRLTCLVDLEKKESREPIALESFQKGIRGRLAKDDMRDYFWKTLYSFRKSYPITLKAGRPYQIDLTGDFDVFVRIEELKYVTLAYSDDVTPPNNLDSRLVFTPQKDGVYRIVVTTYKPGDTGTFTLTVHEAVKAGPDQIVKEELKTTDAVAKGVFFKVHKIDLVAGRPYVFELESPRFDPYLILLDPTGKRRLAQNDDAGEADTSSRIDFTPAESGTYRLVVRSVDAGKTGPYTLRIQGYEPPAPKAKTPGAEK